MPLKFDLYQQPGWATDLKFQMTYISTYIIIIISNSISNRKCKYYVSSTYIKENHSTNAMHFSWSSKPLFTTIMPKILWFSNTELTSHIIDQLIVINNFNYFIAVNPMPDKPKHDVDETKTCCNTTFLNYIRC